MQRRAEDQVVDAGQLLVDALDEVVLDGSDRQGAGGNIGPEIGLFSLEQRHSRLLRVRLRAPYVRDY